MGGVKVGRSRASLPLQVEVERLSPPQDFLVSLEQHLLLVYTGKTRLARNLLQVCVCLWSVFTWSLHLSAAVMVVVLSAGRGS